MGCNLSTGECYHKCIYCYGYSAACLWNTEWDPEGTMQSDFRRNHGRGLCCDPCENCERDIPHSSRACANGEGYRFNENTGQPLP